MVLLPIVKADLANQSWQRFKMQTLQINLGKDLKCRPTSFTGACSHRRCMSDWTICAQRSQEAFPIGLKFRQKRAKTPTLKASVKSRLRGYFFVTRLDSERSSATSSTF
jgi:hypothetical protein